MSHEQPAIVTRNHESLWTSENPLLASISSVAAADSTKAAKVSLPSTMSGGRQKENVFNVLISEPRQSVGAGSVEPRTLQGSPADTFQFDTPFTAATTRAHSKTAGAPSNLFKVSSGSVDPSVSSKNIQVSFQSVLLFAGPWPCKANLQTLLEGA